MLNLKTQSSKGLLLCARYSVAPNFFGYCGPDQNLNLVDHLKENVADKEVDIILSQFETLFSYLKLISKENDILDPFNPKVVEAYWVGNSLLNKVSNSDYVSLLSEKMTLTKKIGERTYNKIKMKVLDNKFYPHHSFHVFNIFKRTGNLVVNHTLETMDSCRIGWGRVEKYSNDKFQISNQSKIIVNTKPLKLIDKKLLLGKPVIKELKVDYKGKSFIKNLKSGDLVSFHWGFVCDVLSAQQVKNLEFYTQKAIDFYNQ